MPSGLLAWTNSTARQSGSRTPIRILTIALAFAALNRPAMSGTPGLRPATGPDNAKPEANLDVLRSLAPPSRTALLTENDSISISSLAGMWINSDAQTPSLGDESPTPRDPDTPACHRVIQVASANPPASANYGNTSSGRPVLSSNGRYLAFASLASNLSPGDTASSQDIFVVDRLTHQIDNVHFNLNHEPANNAAYWISSITPDGRFVFFTSLATNLVPGSPSNAQAFLLDRQSQTIELVGIGLNGAQPNNNCFSQGMTPDGRYVTFYSNATNLVADDTNNQWDVFRRDRSTGQTIRCSVGMNGAQPNGASGLDFNPQTLQISPRQVVISEDGNLVAFASNASNLVANDTNNARDIFVFNCSLSLTERISVNSSGQQANGPSAFAASTESYNGHSIDMTPDGRFVAFDSRASNLVATDPDGTSMNVFIRDRVAGTTIRVPINAISPGSVITHPALSNDGRYLVLTTQNVIGIPGQIVGSLQDYVWCDLLTGEIRLVNANVQGQGAGSNSSFFYGGPATDWEGRFVAFPLQAANLVSPPPPMGPFQGQIYIRDMLPRDCNGNGTLDACDPGWLDLTVFINALLASPQDPAMVCAYDFNRDGLLNGLDVALFTAELMNPY